MRKATMMAAGVLALALAGASFVVGAQAQIAPRSNAPVDIAADQSDFLTQECRSIWKGDVEALQARTRLRAQTLNVYAVKKGDECGETERLVAEGSVYYVEQDRTLEEIVAMGYDEAVVRRVAGLVDRNEYKRRQAPIGVKITPRAFGRDRRLPIASRYKPR